MNKYILTLVSFFLVAINYGQDLSKDEVLQLITDDTCTCIKEDKTLLSPEKSLDHKKMGLGLCLIKSYNNHKSKSKAFADKGFGDFEAIGEEVGLLMISTCYSDFMSLFSEGQLEEFIMEDDDEYDYGNIPPPPPPAPKNENDLNIEGKIVSLNNDVISYVEVVDAFDKKHTLIVSTQFEGAQLLKKSNLKKDFRIYFREGDYYDLSESRYVKKKVIIYLEIIED